MDLESELLLLESNFIFSLRESPFPPPQPLTLITANIYIYYTVISTLNTLTIIPLTHMVKTLATPGKRRAVCMKVVMRHILRFTLGF